MFSRKGGCKGVRWNDGLTAVPRVQMDAESLAVEWAPVLLWGKGAAASIVAEGTVEGEGVAEVGGGEGSTEGEQVGAAAGSEGSILPFCHSAILPFCHSAILPFCHSADLLCGS